MSPELKGKTIFFFGAGASAAEGAPIASRLLVEAFKQFPNDGKIRLVKEFLREFYSNDCSNEASIPTFEEILSPIDICLQKQEQISSKWNYDKLTELRENLIYCICSVIHEKLLENNKYHVSLTNNLLQNDDDWKHFAFISLNYDILLDNALVKLGDGSKANPVDLDYAASFRNEGTDWRSPSERKVYLLKLHGSLNWLFCPTCNSIRITPKEKGVMRIFTHSEVCEKDGSRQRALIIPPTFQKIYDNPFLVAIWHKAERLLREANRVIFVGYSMPESDVHIKYLLKKSLFRTEGSFPKIIVIDRKGKNRKSAEYAVYKRLFGQIDYKPIGFEDFVVQARDFC